MTIEDLAALNALEQQVDDLKLRVLELERHVYGYDLKTREPLPPHTPKELGAK